MCPKLPVMFMFGSPQLSDVEQIGELRLVPESEALVQVERLARRHREGCRPRSFQDPHAAVAEASDGLGRTAGIHGMGWHGIRQTR